MNAKDSGSIYASLSMKLVAAIQNPQKWGDVLDCIIDITPAKGAIITLRDKTNCQIVNDVELEQRFHSPLIRGFSKVAIIHYLTELRTIDPWAAYQKTYYPYRPVQMSRVCPPDTIKVPDFLNWLKGEGFEDTIVFELDRMSGYWTAINLFLEKSEGPEAELTMAFAKDHYDLLRSSWKASQELAWSRQANRALMARAASGGAPVCLAGANGEMIECNALFEKLIDRDVIRLSGPGRKISFAENISIHGLDRWEQHDFTGHRSGTESDPLLILASPIDPDPLFTDKREQLWLLTFTNAGGDTVDPSVSRSFNLSALTARERQLYEEIVKGHSIEQAGEAIGLKRSRAFDVWGSIKRKLAISSVHKLR